MDYNLTLSLTSAVTALIAIVTLIIENRRYHLSFQIDLITRLDAQFNSERMLYSRKMVAQAFKSDNYDLAAKELDLIINFFDGIGDLVEIKALSAKIVWQNFFTYLYRFDALAGKYMAAEQNQDATIWAPYKDLYKKLFHIEKRERKKHNFRLEISPADLEKFIDEELKIKISASFV